jgi:hypothetical protein
VNGERPDARHFLYSDNGDSGGGGCAGGHIASVLSLGRTASA